MYQAQTVKARMTEVTNAMSNISSAIAAKIQEDTVWPDAAIVSMGAAANIQNSLGIAVESIGRVSLWDIDIPINAGQSGAGVEIAAITATFQNTGNPVNGLSVTLFGTIAGDGSITWGWRGVGAFPQGYIPRR